MSVGWLEQQRNEQKQFVSKQMESKLSMIKTKEQFNLFVGDVIQAFQFPAGDETTEAIATVILHAPPDMGSFDPAYVGQRVGKMMANKAAYDFLQELKAKKQAETKAKEVPAVEQSDNQNAQATSPT